MKGEEGSAGATLHPATIHLLVRARRSTGLSELGDPSYQRILDVAIRELVENGDLSLFGSLAIRQNLRQNTASRLRLVELLRRHPEIEEIPVIAPVVITGLYRSGTTVLHRLLASSPDLRAPLFWEMRGIASGASERRKRRRARWSRRIHRFLSPRFEDAHEVRADDAEECFHLFEHCAPTSPFWTSAGHEPAHWLLTAEGQAAALEAYRFFRAQLQVLQWRRPGDGRWLLKWPWHLWHLGALREVFPDVTVVVCRRDFLETVASTCSLAERGMKPFCRSVDRRRLGRFWWDLCELGLERYRDQRPGLGQQVLEVAYRDLVRDTGAEARRVAAELGVAAPRDDVEESLRSRRRRHRYRPSDYGLPPA